MPRPSFAERDRYDSHLEAVVQLSVQSHCYQRNETFARRNRTKQQRGND
jgi:hypothetical protein